MLRIVERGTAEYDGALAALEHRGQSDLERVEGDVRAIIAAVRARGDAALRELTEKIESRRVERFVLDDGWRLDARRAAPAMRTALARAADRIRRYH